MGTNNNPWLVNVTASAEGFLTQTKAVTVFCGAAITLDFGRPETAEGTIVGTVTSSRTGQPLPDVFIGSEFGASDTTDQFGRYRLPGAPLGEGGADREWLVTAVYPEAPSQTKPVIVRASVEVTLDFAFDVATNSPPVADAGGPYEADEGGPVTLDGSNSDDPDGDGLSYEWDFDGQLFTGVTTEVSSADDFVGTVILTVDDGNGGSDTASADIRFNNVAPTVDAGEGQTVDLGEIVSLAPAQFTDPGIADTHAATIDWGDGTTGPGVLVESDGAGTVSGSHTYVDSGDFTIEVCVTDDDGGIGCDTFNATVVGEDSPPLADDQSVSVNEDIDVSVVLTGSGPNDDPLEFIIITLPSHGELFQAGSQITAAPFTLTGDQVTYAPDSNYHGPDGFEFAVDDGNTQSDPATVSITVTPVNDPPVANAGGPYSVDEGSTVNLNASASSDPDGVDGDTLTFEWDLDDDGQFDDAAGPSPSTSFPDNGKFTVRVRVTDAFGPISDIASAIVTVSNVAPSAIVSNDGPVNEGSVAGVNFSGQSDPSSADTAAGFRYSFDFGNDGTFDVIASPVASAEVPPVLLADGPAAIEIRVRIEDKDGGFTDYITVIDVLNLAPTADAGDPYEVDEGSSILLSGTAFDPAGDYDPLTFTWDLDGDGIFGETGVSAVFGDETGRSPTFDASNIDGPDSITVALRVSDGDGGQDEDTAIVEVMNVAPSVAASGDTILEGASAIIGASFTDDGIADTHTAAIDWGDGSAIEILGAVTSPIAPTHIYDDNGSYTVTLTIIDDDSGVGSDTVIVEVSNVAPTAILSNNGPVNEGGSASVDFSGQSDPSSADTTTGFTYSFDFGDDGIFEITDGTVSLADVPADLLTDGPALFPVRGRITDKDGGFTDYVTTMTVNNVAPHVDAGADQIADEASPVGLNPTVFTDAGIADIHTATVDWGDGSPVQAGEVSETAGAGAVNASHAYGDNGVYEVTICVTDNDLAVACDTFEVTVNNVAPTAYVDGDQTVFRGELLSLTGTFTDPAGDADNPFTIQWDRDGDGVFDTSDQHHYGEESMIETAFSLPGIYTVTLAVTDDDGETGFDIAIIEVLNRNPVCTDTVASQQLIWPPNHQFVIVHIIGMTDPDGDTVSVVITGIYQDEYVDSLGDGKFAPDAVGVGTAVAFVRAERSGTKKVPGDGRFYHIQFTAYDDFGGTCDGEVVVVVPHDRNSTPVDGGPLYDSTRFATPE